MDISAQSFEGFKWGVSTAAYQVEGGYNADGKGLSIWDIFSNKKGKTYLGHNGNVASDFYHHYAYDITLISKLNIPNFRFSLSWSRIFSYGIGSPNTRGVDFYNKVIDFCLDLGIEPWVTLYHWDLPHELEKKGGWANRNVVDWFSHYVEFCIKKFGDRVKRWMVLNEPMVFTGAGYFLGVHAPGKKGLNNFLAAAHHAALCQAEGGRIIRAMRPDCKVGTTLSCSYIEPFTTCDKDVQAAIRVDTLLNKLFAEPLAGFGYPVKDLKLLRRLEPFIKDGDESKLAFEMDFVGIQNYTRELVAASYYTPLIWARIIKAHKRTNDVTEMNWEVYPQCIYKMLHKFNAYNFNELIVTENGAAFPDVLEDGKVQDEQRKNYLKQHIEQVIRAKKEGVNVNGYFVWSFTDNFEWAEGYKPRFGLVYIDYSTQKRIIKSSGYWYSKFIHSRFASFIEDNKYA